MCGKKDGKNVKKREQSLRQQVEEAEPAISSTEEKTKILIF